MPMNRYEIGPFIWLMSCVYIRNSSDNSIEGIRCTLQNGDENTNIPDGNNFTMDIMKNDYPEDFVGGNVEGVNNRYEELLVLESEGLVTIDEPE